MASNLSEIDICNRAIGLVDGQSITSLLDESNEGVKCALFYPQVRDALLRQHPWNFAIKQTILQQNVDSPLLDYSYSYALPADCIRILTTSVDQGSFKIVGDSVHTNESTCYVSYISRETDTTIFDSLFVNCLVYKLASELAYPIAGSSSRGDQLGAAFEKYLKEAKRRDGQEGTYTTSQISAALNSRTYQSYTASTQSSSNSSSTALSTSLKTMAYQDSAQVAITGGSVTGITDLAIADGGTGSSTASDARTALNVPEIGHTHTISDITDYVAGGGGTISSQDADNVAITGGSIAGITDITVADGGTGASDASTARINLGLEIGANIQAYDGTLTALAGLVSVADRGIYFTAADAATVYTLTSFGRSLAAIVDAASARTLIGAANSSHTHTLSDITDAGTIASQNSDNVSITGGVLSGITDLSVADGGTGASTASAARTNLGAAATNHTHVVADITDFPTIPTGSMGDQDSTNVSITGGSISGITDLSISDGGTGASSASAARANLELVIGTDVQAFDTELSALAGLVSAANRGVYFTGSGTAALFTLTSFGRSLASQASASSTRTLIGAAPTSHTHVEADITDLGNYSTVGHTHTLSDVTDAGTIASQASDNVSITGGSVAGIVDLSIADGGTGASTASAARVNLGIGTLATQDDTQVTIGQLVLEAATTRMQFDLDAGENPTIQVSPDGSTFFDGIVIDKDNGHVGIGNGETHDDCELFVKNDSTSTTYIGVQAGDAGADAFMSIGHSSAASGESSQMIFDVQAGTSSALIDFTPKSDSGDGNCNVRYFRGTNTTGTRSFQIYKGDGTATTNAGFDGENNCYVNNTTGNFGVGISNPADKLSVAGITAPTADNAYTLGKSGARWSAVWSANGTIQTSDKRDKYAIKDIGNISSGLLKKINPKFYKWKNGGISVKDYPAFEGQQPSNQDEIDVGLSEANEIEPKGREVKPLYEHEKRGKRVHAGFIAQEIKAAFDDLNIDFGAWGLEDVDDKKSKQFIRPDQLIPILWSVVQRLDKRVSLLEAESIR